MRIDTTQQSAANQFSDEVASICTQLVEKGKSPDDCEWYYSIGQMVNGSKPLDQYKNPAEELEAYTTTLYAQYGARYTQSVHVQTSRHPVELVEYVQGVVNNHNRMLDIYKKREKNIFRGSEPRRIDELPATILRQYSSKANGGKFVVYNPHAFDSDEWGFRIYNIHAAYSCYKDDKIRILVEDGDHLITYACRRNDRITEFWNVTRSTIVERVNAANEGEGFAGWRNKKSYKLTQREIGDIVDGRLFIWVMFRLS